MQGVLTITSKYYSVRRELWENDPRKLEGADRTFSQFFKAHRLWYKIVFVAALLLAVIMAVVCSAALFSLISSEIALEVSMCALLAVLILSFILGVAKEKYIYHEEERKAELKTLQKNYAAFVNEIHKTLAMYNVDSKEHVEKLKAECKLLLDAHEAKHSGRSKKAFDMFIGVPLGAFVASIIYSGKDADVAGIFAAICMGFVAWGMVQLYKMLQYYNESYNKDRHLLGILKELDYTVWK